MADLLVTDTSVLKGTDSDIYNGLAGATIVAGQCVYLNTTTNKLLLADANASVTAANVKGIALHGSADGQPLQIAVSGTLSLTTSGAGTTLVIGTPYFLSATPGGLCPPGDLATGMFTTEVGVGKTATTLVLGIKASGALVP